MMTELKRLLRHRLARSTGHTLAPDALQRLTQAVAQAEQGHTGEIRLCVEARLPSSYLQRPESMADIVRQRALSQFSKLRVWDTEHNNGVLIYLLLVERSIELVADRGIDARVAPQVWQSIVQDLREQLQRGAFEEGLHQAVAQVAAQLRTHFPTSPGQPNPNELPDHPDTA